MTEGISKERLIKLRDTINDRFESGTPTHNIYSLILNQLILECTELDPWLPIDENTPKDVKLRLFYPKDEWNNPETIEGKYQSYIPGFDYRKPTHYKLLPDDVPL